MDGRCCCGGTEDHDWLCAPAEERIRLTVADWAEHDFAEHRRDVAEEWAEDERLEREEGGV